MLIYGPEGVKPIQTKTLRSAARRGAAPAVQTDGYYDHFSPSAAEGGGRSFRDLVSSLSREVRTCNTTGKIQDLHRQVQTGEYAVSPRETAARMLLMEEGE